MKPNVGDLIQVETRDNLPKECIDCTGIVVNNNKPSIFYYRFLCLSSPNNNCAQDHYICYFLEEEDEVTILSKVK